MEARGAYAVSRWLFLRGLAAVYLLAFGSLWLQLEGLFGDEGLAPVRETLEAWRVFVEGSGKSAWRYVPSLLWLWPSERALHALCAAGVVFSALLGLGMLPALCAGVLWILYLSLVAVGSDFTSFQWDALLLETGLLAVLYAPWRLRSTWSGDHDPPRPARWLLWWLLFRLMFASGAVKLASGDAAWASCRALSHHYETQPLPTPLAFHAHGLSEPMQRMSCLVMFAIELVLPFLIFGPRRGRIAAFAGFGLLQILIALTGNYGFFNLLTLVIALTLLDDERLARWLPRRSVTSEARSKGSSVQAALSVLLFVPFFALGALQMTRLAGRWTGEVRLARYGEEVLELLAPLRSFNGYGLFAVMTTLRAEVIVEGSADGVTWTAYDFRYKPDHALDRPRWVAPHMPRLDWQMWFLPFAWLRGERVRGPAWFDRLLEALLRGSPAVLDLIQGNPFPREAPRFVRARLVRFNFAKPEHDASGSGEKRWWELSELGEFVPPRVLGRTPR